MQNFMVTVFPPAATSKDLPKLADLHDRVKAELQSACDTVPLLVHPDTGKLVFLATGEYGAIVKALQTACEPDDDRWLLAQVGTPCAANGLAKADGWLRSHAHPTQK